MQHGNFCISPRKHRSVQYHHHGRHLQHPDRFRGPCSPGKQTRRGKQGITRKSKRVNRRSHFNKYAKFSQWT